MKPQTIGTLAWILIYGGGLLVVIALSVVDAAPALGWTMKVMGGISVAAGVFLIWLRSKTP